MSAIKENPPDNFFLSGGGEMGRLTREKDWASTTIGLPGAWPQSLKTTLGIILHSKFPMFLWWGPELLCFYNDAYRPSLGENGKHPHILGMPAKDAWPEIWDTIKPLIDTVLHGGEATWSEDQLIPIFRNGRIEDVYWTFSYSPVNDDDRVVGVLVTCSETTEKVTLINELKEKDRQFNFVIDAAELATWDLNPAINRFTGNSRIKKWFGLQDSEEFDLDAAINNIAPADRQKVADAIHRALQPGGDNHYEVDFTIDLEGQSTRHLVSKGKAVFDKNNQPVRFSGITEDITRKYEDAQKAALSENRFRNTVKQAPVGIAIFMGKAFIAEVANDFYLQLVDRQAAEFIGKPMFDTIPEVRQFVEEILTNVLNTGDPYYGKEFPVILKRHGKDETAYFNFTYQPYKETGGDITGVIVIAMEVTDSVKAKHTLAESEKQFRNMVMQSPIAMTIFRGREYVIEMANKVMFEKIWRKREEEILGKPVLDVFPELKEQKYPELLEKVYATGVIHRESESVAWVQGDDGLRKFYLDFEYRPLYETDGSISGIIITVNDVTEKVAARQQAEDSEREFRLLADSLQALVWRTDAAGQQTFASKRWKEFTGLDPQNAETFEKIVHPDELAAISTNWQHSLTTGNVYTAQTRLRNKNGEYEWFYVQGEPVRNEKGEIEKWIGAFNNFNEVKKAEQELIAALDKIGESEKRLNIVIDASELGTWEWNMQTDAIKYSEQFLQLLGFQKENVPTHDELVKRLHPDDLPGRAAAFQQAFVSGVLDYHTRLIMDDRSERWMHVKGKVFFDEEKKPLLLIGTSRDTTEEKYYQQELEDREKKFRLLADFMPQLVWTADANGDLNYFNQSVHQYSGLDETILAAEGWLAMVHAEDRDSSEKKWLHAIETETDFIHEHRFREAGGEYRWQLTRAIPQKDQQGNIRMWVGTSTDIQEMKELDNQKDLFIGMASHELKTPLTTIKGYVQLLQDMYGEKGDAFLAGSLQTIDKQVVKLNDLIADLLDLSKIKGGHLLLVKETFDINEMVEEIVADTRQVNPANKIGFTSTGGGMLYADKGRLGQVLINFLTNAVKYSPGSKEIQVTVSNSGGNVIVSVADSGIGISKKDQEKIFDRFYRVEGKNEKTFPGFGIGLFIAADIIRKHNGTIGVSSEPGQGSVFYFSLPLTK